MTRIRILKELWRFRKNEITYYNTLLKVRQGKTHENIEVMNKLITNKKVDKNQRRKRI